jgi:hypothetical protein
VNTEGAIKTGQSRETGSIGYTRHKTKTNKTKTQEILDKKHTNGENYSLTSSE